MLQSISIALREISLAGFRRNTEGEPVIALHGWQDNSHSFLPMVDYLPQDITFIAVDFPGHGHSDWRSADAQYYFVDYVDDIYQLMESLSLDSCHFVGHSMGAMVASLFAACFPEKVKSLSLIDGIGLITTNAVETPGQLKKSILHRSRSQGRKPRAYKDLDALVAARVNSGDLCAEHAEILMRRNSRSCKEGVFNRCDPRLKLHSGMRFCPEQAIETVKQINAPAILIRGDSGYDLMDKQLAQYGPYYPKLTVKSVSGGHHCHMESPSDTAHYIGEFIAKVARG